MLVGLLCLNLVINYYTNVMGILGIECLLLLGVLTKEIVETTSAKLYVNYVIPFHFLNLLISYGGLMSSVQSVIQAHFFFFQPTGVVVHL